MLYSTLVTLAGITLQLGTGSATSSPSAGISALPRVALTPAGQAVFLADREIDDVIELWATKLDGSAPWRVSGTLPPNGTLSTMSWWIAPDGQHVAYYGEQVADGDFGLFVARIDGSGFVRASQPGDNLQSISADPWSPDGQWVAYTVKSGSKTELFCVHPDGSARAQLSQVSNPGAAISEFGWAPNSARIAYLGDFVVDNQREIYTATPDGLVNDRVHPALADPGMDMNAFAWSPNGAKIATYGDVLVAGENNLYVSSPSGAGFTDVTQAYSLPGAVLQRFEWTPNGQRLVLQVNAEQANDVELFAVRADGSGWTKLSGALPVAGDVTEFRIAPNGARVAYRADQSVNDRPELYTTKIDGTGNVPISGPFVSGGSVELSQAFFWSPDSAHIAYMADQIVDGRLEIFVTDPTGGGNQKVSGQLYAGTQSSFDGMSPWSPDSQRLTYTANSFGLHPLTVRPDGTGAVDIASPLVAGGAASPALWSPESGRIVYRASQLTFGTFELFASHADGSANQLLSGAMVAGGDVSTLKVH